MTNSSNAVAKLYGKAILVGVLLGLLRPGYEAWHLLAKSRVFEQMNVGLSERTASKILRDNDIYCGISLRLENSCWFSDLWRDYEITLNPKTQTVSRLSYIQKRRRIFN